MVEASPKKTCFVVGPIGQEGSDVRTHSDWLYEGIIKPAFDGFAEFSKPIRADMIAQPGMITTQIIEHLLSDDLVIADLSLLNPNAFYEIGIRHMAQLPIVHMQLKGETGPFDTSGFRTIKFTLRHPSDLVEARRDLAAAIKVAVAPDHRVENPVTHARGAIRLEETATPEQKVLLEEVRALGARIGVLEGMRQSLSLGKRKTRSLLYVKFDSAEISPDAIMLAVRSASGARIRAVNTVSAGLLVIVYTSILSDEERSSLGSALSNLMGLKVYDIVDDTDQL